MLIRIIFILSDLSFFTYGISAHVLPVAYWALACICINLIQIALLIRDMMPRELNEELQAIKKIYFDTLQPSDFLRLMKLSHKSFASNKKLLTQGEQVKGLMMITKGNAYVDIDGTLLQVGNYHFIGEMSYFRDGKASNTIYAREPVHYLYWNYDDLKRLQRRTPALFMKMVEAMGKDLMLKMIEQKKKHYPINLDQS